MRIGVFGCGYVGLVTAACLAETGNDVIGVDVDNKRVEQLSQGIVGIYEPGLELILKNNIAAGRLRFTDSAKGCIDSSDVIFITVGTPANEDGSADLSAVYSVAESIAQHMERYKLVVLKSTVPVGTTLKVQEIITQSKSYSTPAFGVAFNPEFLKEGAAIQDFQRPDRIIIGVGDQQAEQTLRILYAPYNRNREKLMVMDIASAELTKYAANAMLATRISFMNELAGIADRVGADIEQIRIGMGSDPRIGYAFLYAGAGFGGSCFPKDLQALAHIADQVGSETLMVDAVQQVNKLQKEKLFQYVNHYFSSDLEDKVIAVWGLAFKPETDDVREAPSLVLLEQLWAAGAKIQAYDPKAMQVVAMLYPQAVADGRLVLNHQAYDSLQGADALVVVTEWKSFWSPDFKRIKETLKSPLLVDGRNIYDPVIVAQAGLQHYAIGRGKVS